MDDALGLVLSSHLFLGRCSLGGGRGGCKGGCKGGWRGGRVQGRSRCGRSQKDSSRGGSEEHCCQWFWMHMIHRHHVMQCNILDSALEIMHFPLGTASSTQFTTGSRRCSAVLLRRSNPTLVKLPHTRCSSVFVFVAANVLNCTSTQDFPLLSHWSTTLK